MEPKTKGQQYESVAFNFCKASTIILITGKYALPVAAGAASILYLMAWLNGQRDTRCILGRPLVVSAFWGIVAAIWIYLRLR